MIVLTEASQTLPSSPSMRDLWASTETARLLGCKCYHIEQDFTRCDDAAGALSHISCQPTLQPATWLGFIPSLRRYQEIYQAALAKNIRLLNTPIEHQRAQEFDSAYPHIAHLTPLSRFISSTEECSKIAEELGFPVFVKGSIQSRKAKGWSACVAENLGQLEELTAHLLSLDQRSRGKVIVRRLLQLRHTRKSAQGFPFGREYRIFLLDHKILGLGYYWEGDDLLKRLSKQEEESIKSLAIQASKALKVPFVSIDIGQTETLDWVVIESGDAQFSGLSQVNRTIFWQNLISESRCLYQ